METCGDSVLGFAEVVKCLEDEVDEVVGTLLMLA